MAPTKERLVKFTAMPNRSKAKSEDEFHRWWSGTLAPAVIPFLGRHNIVKYTQVSGRLLQRLLVYLAFTSTLFDISCYSTISQQATNQSSQRHFRMVYLRLRDAMAWPAFTHPR